MSEGSVGVTMQDYNFDIKTMIGNVCSYFTYQGCYFSDDDPDNCQYAIYVVLTDVKRVEKEHLDKIKSLSGGQGPRITYVRQEANDLRLAYRQPDPNEICGANPNPKETIDGLMLAQTGSTKQSEEMSGDFLIRGVW